MCPYLELFGRSLPTYGLMICIGVILANIVALFYIKCEKENINDFIIVEAMVFLGAFLGAKILYFLISFRLIQWKRIFEAAYFNELMRGGFVFYGGLIGGLLSAVLCKKIYRINSSYYVKKYICLIPFIHGFGRIGCFLAGCCYGRPYSGMGAVIFPKGSFAPSGISLFPVQLVEAVLLFLLAIYMSILMKKESKYTVEVYLFFYSGIRFWLEYLRYDTERGSLFIFSTSQWISIILIVGMVIVCINRRKNNLT